MFLLAVVFLVPAYYLAKSKGYNVAVVLACSAVLSIGLPQVLNVLEISDGMPWIYIALPCLVLGIIWLLPERAGAPGKKYLKITFDCPECKVEVTFPRSAEGKAELCPECGEVITVPLDEYSPKSSIPIRTKPTTESGPVCYASFGDEMLAAQLQALLEHNRIESELIDGTGGGSMPQLSGSQGFRLHIDIEDWDQAVEIEKTSSSD